MIKSKLVNYLGNANINTTRSHFSSFNLAVANVNAQRWQSSGLSPGKLMGEEKAYKSPFGKVCESP